MGLSANTLKTYELGQINEHGIAASTHIYEGAALGDLAGYARGLVAGDKFIGFSQREVDNSLGSAGDRRVKAIETGKIVLTISGVAVTDLGKKVYASADDTFTLTKGGNTKIGKVSRYIAANTALVEFSAKQIDLEPFVVEIDTETDTTDHVLIPAWMNPNGLLILGTYGRVTEAFAGGDEDQGIITISDESDNAVATLTPSDGGTDSLGDVIIGINAVIGGTTGDAVISVAAGEFVDCKCTQAVSGASAAGKMTVYILAIPLA